MSDRKIIFRNKVGNTEISDTVLKMMLNDGLVIECKDLIEVELTQRKLIEMEVNWSKGVLLMSGLTSSYRAENPMSVRIKDYMIRQIDFTLKDSYASYGQYYTANVDVCTDEIIEF